MITFPDTITIKFINTIDCKPIPKIAAKIKLFAKSKNDYCFLLPLSDDNGIITVSKDWLADEIRKDKELFIMDYSSSLEDCRSQIEIIVLDRDSISRAISAMILFKEITAISNREIFKYKDASNEKFVDKNKSVLEEINEMTDMINIFI